MSNNLNLISLFLLLFLVVPDRVRTDDDDTTTTTKKPTKKIGAKSTDEQFSDMGHIDKDEPWPRCWADGWAKMEVKGQQTFVEPMCGQLDRNKTKGK